MDDLQLLAQFKAHGDREALGKLFERHSGAAYRVARRFFKDSHEAEDAVQTAFLNVMQHAHQFQGRSSVKTWLIASVVNVCRMKQRSAQRREVREREFAPPQNEAPRDELYQAAMNGIEQLPEDLRLPLWMHFC